MPLTCIWDIPIQNGVLKRVWDIMPSNDRVGYYYEPLPQVLNIMNMCG